MADESSPTPAPSDPIQETATIPVPVNDRRHGTSWEAVAPFCLMMIVTVGLFGMLVLMNFHAVPESSTTLMNIILGSIATAWVQGINFFFGSSVSARTKDTAIATLAAKKPATGAATS